MTCSIEECEKPAKDRGLCEGHFMRRRMLELQESALKGADWSAFEAGSEPEEPNELLRWQRAAHYLAEFAAILENEIIDIVGKSRFKQKPWG